jgi:hypothetical protein
VQQQPSVQQLEQLEQLEQQLEQLVLGFVKTVE